MDRDTDRAKNRLCPCPCPIVRFSFSSPRLSMTEVRTPGAKSAYLWFSFLQVLLLGTVTGAGPGIDSAFSV